MKHKNFFGNKSENTVATTAHESKPASISYSNCVFNFGNTLQQTQSTSIFSPSKILQKGLPLPNKPQPIEQNCSLQKPAIDFPKKFQRTFTPYENSTIKPKFGNSKAKFGKKAKPQVVEEKRYLMQYLDDDNKGNFVNFLLAYENDERMKDY